VKRRNFLQVALATPAALAMPFRAEAKPLEGEVVPCDDLWTDVKWTQVRPPTLLYKGLSNA